MSVCVCVHVCTREHVHVHGTRGLVRHSRQALPPNPTPSPNIPGHGSTYTSVWSPHLLPLPLVTHAAVNTDVQGQLSHSLVLLNIIFLRLLYSLPLLDPSPFLLPFPPSFHPSFLFSFYLLEAGVWDSL